MSPDTADAAGVTKLETETCWTGNWISSAFNDRALEPKAGSSAAALVFHSGCIVKAQAGVFTGRNAAIDVGSMSYKQALKNYEMDKQFFLESQLNVPTTAFS